MKTIISFILLLTIIPVYSQNIFQTADFKKIVEIDSGYLSLIYGVNDPELKDKIINQDQCQYCTGLGMHDISGNIKWIYVFENNRVLDFNGGNKYINILSENSHNSKIESSSELYLTILDKQGKLINEEKLSYIEAPMPNSRMMGIFSANSYIYTIAYWEGSDSVIIDGKKRKGCTYDNYLIRCKNPIGFNCDLYYNVCSENLRLEATSVLYEFAGFVFSGESVKMNNNAVIPGHSVIFLSCYSNMDEIEGVMEYKVLGNGPIEVSQLEANKEGIFISGSFKGSYPPNNEPETFIRQTKLVSPKNKFRNESARNAFIAKFSYSLEMEWIKTIWSEYDISIESISNLGDSIALVVKYNDLIKIDKQEIRPIQNTSNYEYTDQLILFFDNSGNLKSFEQPIGNGYDKIKILSSQKHIIIYGQFLNKLKIFDYKLNDHSSQSVNFIIFKKK